MIVVINDLGNVIVKKGKNKKEKSQKKGIKKEIMKRKGLPEWEAPPLIYIRQLPDGPR